MNDDVIILDDFLPKNTQNKIEELCYDLKWNLIPNSTPHEVNSTINTKLKGEGVFEDSEQLVNVFWDTRIKKIDSSQLHSLGHYFLIPLQIACINKNIIFDLKKNLSRAKVNITFNKNNNTPIPKFPHLDWSMEDKDFLRNNFGQIIYYVNNSDGDTIVYNEKDYIPNISQYTIKQRISPKKGRIVFLRGDVIHSASIPSNKHSKRIVINYNLKF